MVGEPKTCEQIDTMVGNWASIVRTRCIRSGMDETHDHDRRRCLNLHGYRHGFVLFNERLSKVAEIHRKHGDAGPTRQST